MSQRQNAASGETETNLAAKRTIIGLVSGAIVGLATDKGEDYRIKLTLISATTGGAIDADVSYYFAKS